MPIEYAPRTRMPGYISPDDVGISETETCEKWSCQKWQGREPVYPVLEKDVRGFWVCPKCGASYGKGARPHQPEKIACISLWQPWASLLMLGPKLDETRGWAPPIRLMGERFLICAAKGNAFKDATQELSEIYGRYFSERPPLGVALGTARLVRFQSTNGVSWSELDPENLLCGNWNPNRFAWRFGDRKPFEKPVPMRGRQRIWYASLEGDLARAIRGTEP